MDATNEAEVTFSSAAGSIQMRMMLGNAGSMENLMHFSYSDVPAAKRKAMKQAVLEAGKSAAEIAGLTNSKLGKVLQVTEVEELNVQPSIQAIYGLSPQQENPQSSATTTKLGKIKVQLKLRVKFELLDE